MCYFCQVDSDIVASWQCPCLVMNFYLKMEQVPVHTAGTRVPRAILSSIASHFFIPHQRFFTPRDEDDGQYKIAVVNRQNSTVKTSKFLFLP
jgi:hypothetical protein